ncbi:hypothetical protein POL68_10455 [Stigmatella sp. ncwal1]|uniref:Iron-containing redox enzyme n=1 Tax=Stigmatella ashevillensis TaxID=2995309 RepID=A0ABT5D9C3_9BACT|nr:hypothetical protein [Stigmatella ashevillena]MDC0708887.1 hypothetical protein [Stigmatella ashevillena]
MSQAIRSEFRTQVDALLDSMIESIYKTVPTVRYLANSEKVDVELFKRHTIETILRIRLARIADSKAVYLFTKNDPVAAHKWSKYMEEEMLHDKLFLKDLTNMGVEEAAVYGTDPLLATKLLQGYLYYTLEHEGARGLITKSYFVEYTTRKTQRIWNENIKRSLGDKSVRGAEAHLNYDVDEDHSTDVWNVLMTMVNSTEEEARVIYHLNVYAGLFSAYFNELASKTKSDLLATASGVAATVVLSAQDAKQKESAVKA